MWVYDPRKGGGDGKKGGLGSGLGVMMMVMMMTTMAIYKLCHVSPDKKSLNASAKSPLHFSFLVWSSGGYILRKFPCRTKIYKNAVLLSSPYPTSRKDWVTERNVKLSWSSYGGHVRKFKLDVSATEDELSSWSDRHYSWVGLSYPTMLTSLWVTKY